MTFSRTGSQTKGRRGLFRRRRTELPPVSLSPDEWIASLVEAPPSLPFATEGGEQPAPDSRPVVGGNGHTAGVGVVARPALVNGHQAREPVGTSSPAGQAGAGGGTGSTRRRTWRTVLVTLLIFVLSVGLGFAAFAAVVGLEARRDLTSAESRVQELSAHVAALTAERDSIRSQLAGSDAGLSQIESELSATLAELERVRESKKVVVTRKVPVPTRVPNGNEISVETTGFEDVVEVFDVQLTHAYGFSDLVGIARNNGEETIAYVQIGCSFLDAKGRVLANVIDNRENWAPGATWGFDCSAEVDATGGIVRVDVAD